MQVSSVQYGAQAVKIRTLGFIAFAVHLLLIHLPSVNLEWSFLDAAQAIAHGCLHASNAYFFYEANTLGMPILYALIAKCLPIIPFGLIPRLISGLSFLVLAEALLRLYRQMQIQHSVVALTLVIFLNPLIWIYAGRGTADLFPMSLAVLAMALFLEETRSFFSPQRVSAIVWMNIAITLKYHAALLIPLCCLGFLSIAKPPFLDKKRILHLLLAVILMIPVPLLYIFWLYDTFHFWIISSHFHGIFQPSIRHSLENFIIYGGYFCLLLLPFSVLQIGHSLYVKQLLLKAIGVSLVVFFIGWMFAYPDVEMNFGPLDTFLHGSFLGGILSVLAVGLGFIFYRFFVDTDTQRPSQYYIGAIIAGILCYIMFLSLTRPANRYLLFVLPFGYCLLWLKGQLWRNKSALYLGLGLYILVNMYLMDYQNTQGLAAIHMVNQLEKKHLIPLTNPGSIDGHVGNYFYASKGIQKKYVVDYGSSSDAMIVVKQQGFFCEKTYSLKRIDQHG